MAKKPQGLRDIINDVVYDTKRVAKGTYKAANWISQPKNQNKVGKGIAENFLASKEITKIAKGKGSKQDAAKVAATAASYLVPYGKLYKGIDMAVKGGKVAKGVRGVAKTTGTIGGALAVDSAVTKGVGKVGNAVTKSKSKSKVKGK